MKNSSTKQRILDAAMSLFKEKGYDEVKIEDICERSNITKSTFYYHFKTKDAIFTEYNHSVNAYVEENFNALLLSSNYVEQLWDFYRLSMTPTYEAGFEIASQIYIVNMKNDQKYFAPGELDIWSTEVLLIQKAQETHQIHNKEDAAKIAESLVYSMEGITFVWCIKKGAFDLAEKIKEIFFTILQVDDEYKF